MTIQERPTGQERSDLPLWAQHAIDEYRHEKTLLAQADIKRQEERRTKVTNDGLEALSSLGIEGVSIPQYDADNRCVYLTVSGFIFVWREHTGAERPRGLYLVRVCPDCRRDVELGAVPAGDTRVLGAALAKEVSDLPYHRCGDLEGDLNYRHAATLSEAGAERLLEAVDGVGPEADEASTEDAFRDLLNEYIDERVERKLAEYRRGQMAVVE